MNPHSHSQLNQRSKEKTAANVNQTHSGATQTAHVAALEFGSPEDLLRHEAAQTDVPARVAKRLQDSIREEPPRRKSWLRRLFGG